jgi:hypothetical protein
MKLLILLLLGIIGFTADAAFSLGVVGTAMNLSDGTPRPEFGLAVFGDFLAVVILFFAIIFRVHQLVRSAAERAQAGQ